MTAADETPFPLADSRLALRLEMAEARANAEFVDARAKVFPDSGARWIEVDGAFAMFDGPASPVTQTFGLGISGPVTDVDLDVIENFFRERGADVFHEVSPLADAGLLPLLNERGYRPIEFTSVMYRPVSGGRPVAAEDGDKVRVRLIGEDEQGKWAQTSASGWSEYAELKDFLEEMGRVSAKRTDTRLFLAELGDRPIAAGALSVSDRVALLAGASTIPEARRQGAQLALLEGRLRHAARENCDLVMMCAAPGSASQRNAERNGFRIAYTRIKWRLAGRDS